MVVTDLPVLREVGGSEARYCHPASIDSWTRAIGDLLSDRATAPEAWRRRRQRCRLHAAQFSWARTADQLAAIYQDVASRMEEQRKTEAALAPVW